MIKTVIKMKPGFNYSEMTRVNEITAWLTQQLGSQTPRGDNNKKKRRVWSIKADYFQHTITIMCRKPQDAMAVRLRWL
jgi:hypothetical protein